MCELRKRPSVTRGINKSRCLARIHLYESHLPCRNIAQTPDIIWSFPIKYQIRGSPSPEENTVGSSRSNQLRGRREEDASVTHTSRTDRRCHATFT
ncbi:hypothetical protein JTE90_017671 [Oedothorax gibbosus]|uniref:Uncharacterized protein n=1 Tax=Oedothorax gibbosus TaxID=931172 RepID=A0AAV6UFU4_9ARAC|nr:hypothetical protein JTE90_017671 [Oedothorax gibbosus]